MPDMELIDRLVATYRILNHTVRQRPEADLDRGDESPRLIIHDLRNDELHFSQNLKARISGQPVGLDDTEGRRDVGTAGLRSTTAELIAQVGTARESPLAMLRSLPDDQWDVTTDDYPRSIRTEVFDLVARDRQVLDKLGRAIGESLTELAPA